MLVRTEGCKMVSIDIKNNREKRKRREKKIKSWKLKDLNKTREYQQKIEMKIQTKTEESGDNLKISS